ncbi:MAG: hypothetical protein ABIZ30_06405, partial [Candidatus Limnocylindrales bacterium]
MTSHARRNGRDGTRRTDPDANSSDPPGQDGELGFSTRAIRAASHAPEVRQRPSSVPIYQTAT